jgi:hypothetical protein
MIQVRNFQTSTRALKSLLLLAVLLGISPLAALGAAADDHVPTFSKDIAPIFQKSCQGCHHAGSIAPMSLITYQDARPWARSIKAKVVTRVMPPWHIDRNVGIQKFKNDPSLSDKEIAAIASWVDHGAPEGNPADMPAPLTFSNEERWQFKPDVVVSMAKPYVLAANVGDQYYDVDVDPHFTQDMYVQAIQTMPTIGFNVVHHFDTNIVEDPQADPIGLFLSEYAVGKGADVYPTNTGRMIKAGTLIHFQIHLHSDVKDTPVSVAVGLKLYPKGVVPKYIAFTQHMGDHSTALDIEAGQTTRSDGYFRLPRAAVLTAFQPHFHTLGKAQCVEAVYPDVRADSARPGPARTETISCVSNYQYGWSVTYPYADDVAPLLPAGTVLHVTTWHDNTTSNPFDVNPMNWVGDGARSNDEMGFAWISLFYLDDADYQQRVQARKARASQAQE